MQVHFILRMFNLGFEFEYRGTQLFFALVGFGLWVVSGRLRGLVQVEGLVSAINHSVDVELLRF